MTKEEQQTVNASLLIDGLDGQELAFLEMAGRGCISGRVLEWPQLVTACKYAVDEIKRLQTLVLETALVERERCAILCEKSDRYRGDYFAHIIRTPPNEKSNPRA